MDRVFTRRQVLKAGAAGAAGAAALASLPGGVTAQSASPAASGAAGGYTPPASDTSGTLTISNWGDPPDQQVYSGVKERFNAKYPNVTVNDNFTPITTWTDYINKLVADVAAGNAPDIINIAIEGVRQGLSKDLFMPLTSWITTDSQAQAMMKEYDQPLLDGLSYQGQLYLLPNTWNTMLIYYNTKMFESAGIDRPKDDWTWDEFLDTATKLTTGSADSQVFGFLLPYFNFGLTPWWYSNGTSELNADWTASNLTDPKMVEAATWVRDLVTTHNVAPQPKGVDPYQLFPAGKGAMTGAGHWVVGPFKTAGFQDYDVVPWPRKEKTASVYGVSGFGIYPQTQSPDLAWEYVKELAGLQTQQAWVAGGAANPSMRSVAHSPEFLAFPPHANLYYDAIQYALPVAAPTVFSTLDPAIMRAMDSILAGTDPAAALAQADQEVNDAFANA
jgi:multiple sugar transport system substrate-binding protein